MCFLCFTKAGIVTIGDYVNAPTDFLRRKMGKLGVDLKDKLLGYDCDEVKSFVPLPKSVSNGTTTIIDIISKPDVNKTIAFLCDKISSRLRKQNLLARTVGVTIKTSDFAHFSHETKMDYATNNSNILQKCALALVDSFWNYDQNIRSITVRTAALVYDSQSYQQSIFENPKIRGLGYGIDQIRQKYGDNSVVLASNIKSDFINNKDS